MLDKIKQKLSNASDNDKIVYRNVIGSFIVKGGALFVSLFTLPAYIKFFNNDIVLGCMVHNPVLAELDIQF